MSSEWVLILKPPFTTESHLYKTHVKLSLSDLKVTSETPFLEQESLGYVEIGLSDVVTNKRINEKYHLIDSKNGRIQIELQWRTSSWTHSFFLLSFLFFGARGIHTARGTGKTFPPSFYDIRFICYIFLYVHGRWLNKAVKISFHNLGLVSILL